MKKADLLAKVTPVFAEEGVESSARARWWFLVPLVVAVVAVAILYYRQQVLLIPIPARPLSGSVVDSRHQVGFTWTRLQKKSTQYHIQIAADRGFRRMLYETRVQDLNEIKPSGIFGSGHHYYWRLQSIVAGKTSPWTRTMKFRTE